MNSTNEPSPYDAVVQILDDRGRTNGDYYYMSNLAQSLKDVMRRSANWDRITTMQRESLELMATKISRILTGDPDFADHWDDISGYAQLGKKKNGTIGT